jgi:hypothetical protein
MRVYFHLPCRQTEGIVRAHANEMVPSIPDYSTINRRVNKLDIKINEKLDNDIVIASASTGIKVANREENGCSTNGILDIKKKKIISLEVSSEEVHDSQMLKKLIYNASKNNVVKRVLWMMVHTTVRQTSIAL